MNMKQANQHQVVFYFDFISPYSYLAVTQMQAFAIEHQVLFDWQPVNLPKLIQLSGNVPPASSKNKALYLLHDLKRWASYLDVPLKILRPGSFDSRDALRMALSLQGEQRAQWCCDLFQAIWSGEINPKQEHWLAEFQSKQTDMAPMQALQQSTEQALQAGAFGAPTFVLKPRVGTKEKAQMFFGIDRMNFLAQACDRRALSEQ